MCVFDMITNPSRELTLQAAQIHEQHFTIDTAPMPVVWEWLAHNPYTDTYALCDGKVVGFFNVLPLTTECGALFEQQAIREEDLSIEHILPHEALQHAQYTYIAAIAVKDTGNYQQRQCVAAMISCLADLLLHGYSPKNLRTIFANPTTFSGNKMVRKLGLQPLVAQKKALKENDIYTADMNAATRAGLEKLSRRYARFVGDNPWQNKFQSHNIIPLPLGEVR